MTNIFLLGNQSHAKLAVQLEPWAEVYYLRQGETLRLEQPPISQGYYHVVFYEADSVSVLVEGFLDYPQVSIAGRAAAPSNDFAI